MAKEQTKQYVKDPAAVAKNIHVPTYSEILERIRSRYPRAGKTIFDREMARLQVTYDILISKTSFIRELVKLIDSLHPFYWRLIEIDFDRALIHNSIKCISRSRKLASTLFEKYRFLLMASSNRRELLRTGSEGRGRILSTIKKCKKGLEYLRDFVIFIQHLPSIDATLPTIIVAGAPSTGKSTLVKNVSRAHTKIASYPFTTTTIHIGHFIIKNKINKIKIQIIDTPGLLDRPTKQMNPIERRAIAALSELEGAILFLVDVSPESYINVQRQFYLLIDIINNYSKNKIIYIGINKIDQADPHALEEARQRASALLRSGAVAGVDELASIDSEQAKRVIIMVSRAMGLV